jgi:tetratricopeptide (TPR) repeat protein
MAPVKPIPYISSGAGLKAAIESADTACAAGECEAAINLLEEAVRGHPYDFRLHYRLGLCYGGCCRDHPLVQPDMAIPYLRQALRLAGADPRQRAAVADQLANTLLHSRTMPLHMALRAAIDCHVEAAELYASLELQDEWARVEFNLGNSWCDLSEITGEDHWREAVTHYENALRVRTREKDPERYAAVLENLGAAYRRLPGTDAAGNIRKCIQCYRRALCVYAPKTHPEKNATLENNLGNAFLSLPEVDERSAARNARRALRHFERALRIQSRNAHSRVYGITQYNLAQAYFRLARSSPGDNLRLAVGSLEAAGAAFQACGEDRYLQVIRIQLERFCRS